MKRFTNILYLADGRVSQRQGLDRAVALAQANRARLTVIDVTERVAIGWDLGQQSGIKLTDALAERRLDELEVLTEPYADAGIMLYTDVLTGTPFIEVIRAVQRQGYDLLMKTAGTGGGAGVPALGSTDMHLLRKCPCPVWIDHPSRAYPYRAVLAAVDPTDTQAGDLNRLILDLATSLAEREGAALDVVHAWRLPGEDILRSDAAVVGAAELEALLAGTERGHRNALDRILAPYGRSATDPSVHLVAGEPATAIGATAEASGADLIVMGTVGGLRTPGLFIGRTAEDVLRATPTSVLAVKPADFVCPVTLP